MPLAKNGRGIQRLYWVDEQGVESIILLAYLGERVVWDGHVHQVLQVPRAVSLSEALVPLVSAGSLVEFATALSHSEALLPVVSGGVTVYPLPAASMSSGSAPVVHSTHVLDLVTATSASEAYAPEIMVVFGVTPPPAMSVSQAWVPQLHAGALISPAAALSYSAAHVPDVGGLAIVSPPSAMSTSQAHVPVLHTSHLVAVPAATSVSQAYALVVHAAAAITPTTAISTSQAYAPMVGDVFTPMGMNKDGNFSSPTGTWTKVTGWTADTATYPGSVVTSDGISPGGGPVNITARVAYGYENGRHQLRVCVDGVPVVTGSENNYPNTGPGNGGGYVTATASAVTIGGGLITVEFYASTNFSGANSVRPTNTYLRVTSA